MADRVVNFEGHRHHFPSDATDEEISTALSSMHPMVAGMEKLGGTPPPPVAPPNAINDFESAQGDTYAGHGRFGSPTRDAVVGGLSMLPAAMTTPGALALGVGASYGARKGAKALGADEGISDLVGMGAGALTGGLYGKFLPQALPSELPIPGSIGKSVNEWLSRARPQATGTGMVPDDPAHYPFLPPIPGEVHSLPPAPDYLPVRGPTQTPDNFQPPYMNPLPPQGPSENYQPPYLPPHGPQAPADNFVPPYLPPTPPRVQPRGVGGRFGAYEQPFVPPYLPPQGPQSTPDSFVPPYLDPRGPFSESAAQPSTSPIDGSSVMMPSGEAMQPIDKFEMNRMLHARAQEANLPGSPAGANGHPQISKTAKDVFGLDSASKMSVQQMKAVHDFLDRTGRMPLKGEIQLP